MTIQQEEKLTVFGKTICPKCMFVERQLNDKSISYKKVNLDHDEAAAQRLRDLGLMSLPIIEVNGEIISNHGEIIEYIESI